MQIQHYVWIVLAVVLLLVELWAIRSVLRSTKPWDSKGVWVVVIVFVPLLGLLAWLVAGPKGSARILSEPEHQQR